MGKGRLIILEGGDASGKATQTRQLEARLKEEGRAVQRVEFPDYDAPSSALVKLYLSGAFGKEAAAVDPYAASVFFAVDRYASYHMKWKAHYEGGGIVLSDRYTTSNMVHQAVKIAGEAARAAYIAWLADFEYEKLGLPRPDGVIFLDMDPAVSDRLMAARRESEGREDIHEADLAYLHRCHEAYQAIASRFGWRRILCSAGGAPRPAAEIAAEVYAAALAMMEETTV
ncbi:MAG: dTMP kinase [Schwartzia sp. (in: firmicutes)]